MICPNCKVKISESSKYCPRCGTLFDNKDVEKHSRILETELINLYIDPSQYRRVSLGFLFFNFAYAFYKKMYFQGFISFFIDLFLVKFLVNGMNIIVSSGGFLFITVVVIIVGGLFLNLYYLFNFNDLYMNRVKLRVNHIIKIYGTKNSQLLRKLCINDRRGNLWLAIISIVLFAFSIFGI